MDPDGIEFSQRYTYGDHLYRKKGETAEIIFENRRIGIKKVIIDDHGRIADFPGVAHPELVSNYSDGFVLKKVRYESQIKNLDGDYALIWQIRPDGQYWEDEDGYGRTPDDRIDLYARIDEYGKFTEPFHIYAIGSFRFYGTDMEEKIERVLSDKKDLDTAIGECVPDMIGKLREYMDRAEKGEVFCSIPGTVCVAEFTLKENAGDWYVMLSLSKTVCDPAFIGFLRSTSLEEQREYLRSGEAAEDAKQVLSGLFDSMGSRG